MRMNLFWALVYNCIGIPVAGGVLLPVFGMALPPEFAGLAMALSSVSVVLSSLALKYYKRPVLLNQFQQSVQHRDSSQVFTTSAKAGSAVIPGSANKAGKCGCECEDCCAGSSGLTSNGACLASRGAKCCDSCECETQSLL